MLSTMDYDLIWKLLVSHGVTHYNGAPTVQNEVCNNKHAVRLSHPVKVLSGGKYHIYPALLSFLTVTRICLVKYFDQTNASS